VVKIKKYITFTPHRQDAALIENHPKPSKNFIPEWYKKIPRFEKGSKKMSFPMHYRTPNVTIKTCLPFLESMTNGYMVYLYDDIFVEEVDGVPMLRWRAGEDLVTAHSLEQFPINDIPFSDNFCEMPFKFSYNWQVNVPKGYSILFSHPHNRIDLPFYTFSGFVNSDSYNMPVQFPFLLKKGFEGVIEAGTPISQLTIVKNESWKSTVEKYDPDEVYKKERGFNRSIHGAYKKYFWNKDNSFE
jgi:hypothetical protein